MQVVILGNQNIEKKEQKKWSQSDKETISMLSKVVEGHFLCFEVLRQIMQKLLIFYLRGWQLKSNTLARLIIVYSPDYIE